MKESTMITESEAPLVLGTYYQPQSAQALHELELLGLTYDSPLPRAKGIEPVPHRPRVKKRAIQAPEVLNEATDYAQKTSFSRGTRLELPGFTMLLISGTASVNEEGKSLYPDDFEAQCWRTYRNITHLLATEESSWHDIVRTTCYLRDIERDYARFNEIRTAFFEALGLDPLPASTGIQARLCRSDLLVEIEAIAIIPC